MFAAGRKAATASGSQGDNHDDINTDSYDNNSLNAQLNDDWLQIGKSFSGGTNTDTVDTNSSLQVYKHRRSKHKHEEKKKKKRRHSEEESVTHFDSKHKKKSKHKKRPRERSYADSSDDNERHHSRHQSRRHRRRSRSRSRSRSHREEMRIVKQPTKEIKCYEQVPVDTENKIFEMDCKGDLDNQFYGSTYVHDQPLYELATRRNLLTGAWISSSRSKYNGAPSGKKEEKQWSDRYFSLQARKMERDARQKRLYLAYSEKRLARAEANGKVKIQDQGGERSTKTIVERPTGMEFIPLDPVVNVKALVGDTVEGEGGHGYVPEGVMLTDAQNVEQHLVARTKMFNTALTANPHDIDTWLNFVAFQDETLRLQTKGKKLSIAVKTSVEEKQAAILDRALESNPHSRILHRVKLNVLLHAQTDGDRADLDSIQRQLEDLLSQDTTNSNLWLNLIQSRQQHFGNFSMQSVRDLYARILAVLRAESESIVMSSTMSEKNVENNLSTTHVQELWGLLLDFHFLMCTFEMKAGYVERSIIQLQALIDFSLKGQSRQPGSGDRPTYLEMLREFASRWDKVGAIGFGDEALDGDGSIMGGRPFQPSMTSFEQHIQTSCTTSLDQVSPPETLRTTAHKQSLLSGSATYQRKANVKMVANAGENSESSSINTAGSVSSDAEESDSRQSGKLVYSNLHGYRISVDDADDTREYERILSELRGTESARARQDQLLERDNRKRAVLASTLSQVEDQRSNYPSIEKNDDFVKWLMREEKQSQMQWAPLRSSNPLHQELIEEQPDRATLTEEIQPFLFSVPKEYHWRLIAELLQVCGVGWRNEYAWDGSQQVRDVLYADNTSDYELLVAPILAALNPHAKNQALMLSPWGRTLLLETALLEDVATKENLLYNPSKVDFIRRIFEQALSVSDLTDKDQDHDFHSTLKCLWIGFEAEVARVSTSKEPSLAYARHLSQQLSQTTCNGGTDFDVLYAYAKLELRLGNERQVRRICDNTLAAIGAPSSSKVPQSRIFHRFVFLRARLEIWPSTADRKSKNAGLMYTRSEERLRTLRCLYTLWYAWELGHADNKELENLDMITRKYRKRTCEVLQGRLMSDPSIEASLMTKYREEFDRAIQRCEESCKEHRTTGKPRCKTTCWAGYCLHNLALIVYAYQGFDAACKEYRQAVNNADHRHCPHLEWIWVCFLEFMQQHQASGCFPVVAPRIWRLAVGEAVELFPGHALFLRLFVDSETGNTISQVLRNHFLRIEKRSRRHYDSPELVEWLFALLCELYRVERAAALLDAEQSSTGKSDRLTCCLFHHWDMNATAVGRIRRVFENMVGHIRTKGNALCWRLYLRFEVALGKVDAAKKVFYRGIAACAWSKELYMDGIRVLRAYLSEDECLELFEFMDAKELNVRVDFDNGV